ASTVVASAACACFASSAIGRLLSLSNAGFLADLLLEFGVFDDFLEFLGQFVVPVRLREKSRQLLADFHELAQWLDLSGDLFRPEIVDAVEFQLHPDF